MNQTVKRQRKLRDRIKNQLPPEVRIAFLRNIGEDNSEVLDDRIQDLSFVIAKDLGQWDETEEGEAYWATVYENVKMLEDQNK